MKLAKHEHRRQLNKLVIQLRNLIMPRLKLAQLERSSGLVALAASAKPPRN